LFKLILNTLDKNTGGRGLQDSAGQVGHQNNSLLRQENLRVGLELATVSHNDLGRGLSGLGSIGFHLKN